MLAFDDLDALRATCKITVVPDQGGTGISVKMLTALVSLHPVVTTRIGLRGLDPAITSALLAFDEPEELAQDILDLLSADRRIDTRRELVRQVLERFEAIAWEVIPQMAEALVREEIRRMKGEEE